MCMSLCISVYVIIINIHSYLYAFVFDILYSLFVAFFHHLLLVNQDLAEIPPLPLSLLLPAQAKEFTPFSELPLYYMCTFLSHLITFYFVSAEDSVSPPFSFNSE